MGWKSKNQNKNDEAYHYFNRELQETEISLLNCPIGTYRIYWECFGGENDEISAIGTISNDISQNIFIFEEFNYQPNLPDTAILFPKKVSKNLIISRVSRKTYYMDWLNRFCLLFMTFAGCLCLAEITQFFFRKIPEIGNSIASGIVVISGLISISYAASVISFVQFEHRPFYAIFGFLFVSLPWIGIYYKSWKLKRLRLRNMG